MINELRETQEWNILRFCILQNIVLVQVFFSKGRINGQVFKVLIIELISILLATEVCRLILAISKEKGDKKVTGLYPADRSCTHYTGNEPLAELDSEGFV